MLRFTGPDHCHKAEAFASILPEAEFAISGHIVADACVDAWQTAGPRKSLAGCGGDSRDGETLLHLSILTVEDW